MFLGKDGELRTSDSPRDQEENACDTLERLITKLGLSENGAPQAAYYAALCS